MDLKQLIDHKPCERLVVSIGELCLFRLSGGAQTELFNNDGPALAARDPSSFVRRLVRHVCFPSDALREGKYKPDNPVLDDAMLAALTEDDLNQIADAYLKHHEYLYRQQIENRKKDEKGTPVISFSYGDVEHPKKEDETSTQYLARLLLLYRERFTEQVERSLKILRNSLPGSVLEDVHKTLFAGEALKNSFERLRMPELPNVVPHVDVGPRMADVFHNQRRAFEKPFELLGKKLDELTDAVGQTVSFAVKANKTHTRIAGVLTRSASESRRQARLNIRLTAAVIMLTVAGLGFSILQSLESDDQIRTSVEQLIEELKGIRTATEIGGAQREQALRNLETEVGRLQAELESRSRSAEQLENEVREQLGKIHELEVRLGKNSSAAQ